MAMLFTYIAQLNKKILVLTQYHSYKPWPSFILRFLIYACKSLGTVYRHQTVLGDTQRQFLNSFVKFLLLNSLEKLKRFILITPPQLDTCCITVSFSWNSLWMQMWGSCDFMSRNLNDKTLYHYLEGSCWLSCETDEDKGCLGAYEYLWAL